MTMKLLSAVACVMLTMAGAAFAQQPGARLSSKAANVTLVATVPSYVSVVPATTQATFDFASKTNAQTAFGVTVNWGLSSSAMNGVQLYAYFDSAPSALLDGSGHAIAANRIDAAYGGAAFSRFAMSSEPLLLYTQAVTSSNRMGTVTNPLNLRLNLPLDQAPGRYQGVLHLRAQTY
jgi:hypothetical protein